MEKYDNDNDRQIDELKDITPTEHDDTQIMQDDGQEPVK